MELKPDIPIGVQFSLKAEDYSTYPISDIPFSVRVMNRLMVNKISTVEILLNTTPKTLMSFSSFGKNCMNEIVSNIGGLSKGQNTKAYTTPFVHISASAKIKEYAENFAVGDFSAIEATELDDREQAILDCYKEAFSVLGEEMTLDCYASPEKIVPIVDMFNAFILENEKRNELIAIAEHMPDYRRKNKAAAYINAFTNDEQKKKTLFDLCADDSATLDSLFMSVLPNDRISLTTLTRFLEWCAFDLPAETNHIFELLYKKDNIKTVVQMRARKKTLEQTGAILGVTRERVRQIEAKAKRQFTQYQGRIKPLLKIAADMNGATIVSPADIEEYCTNNVTELLFVKRKSRNISIRTLTRNEVRAIATLFSTEFRVSKEKLRELGVFNTFLDEDSSFFINLKCLKECDVPEFAESYNKINDRFLEIGMLLKQSTPGSRLYRAAYDKFNFSEVNAINLGFASGKYGAGFGKQLRTQIIKDAFEIIQSGSEQPEIFHLVGLFEDNVGPDRLCNTHLNHTQVKRM